MLKDRFLVWFEFDAMYRGFDVPKASILHVANGSRTFQVFVDIDCIVRLC